MGFPSGSDGKEFACNAGDPGLITGLGRPSGEGELLLLSSLHLVDRGLEAGQASNPGSLDLETTL